MAKSKAYKQRRAAARKADLVALRDGLKNRAVRFTNRKKQASKDACRKGALR